MKYRYYFLCATAALIVFSVTGCHSNSSNNAANNPNTPPLMSDAFITEILAFIATSPEDTEPASTDTFTATSPETTEPILI